MTTFDAALIYSGLVLGILGTLTGVICLVMLRRRRAEVEWKHCELESIIRQQHDESARGAGQIEQSIAQLSRSVADLELNARNIGEAGWGGLTRTRRSQAMQLLRSGVSPESAASTLGIAMREMRLISRVSRILSLQ
jgi:hypothetical protein